MQWSDEGIVLSIRQHGESSVIVDLLTAGHGRHSGLVRGGRSKRLRPLLQPGNRVEARWRARLPEHLGMYILEPLSLRAALVMDDPQKLLALQSVCALCSLLAEREPHAGLFEATELMLEALTGREQWLPLLVHWELGLLAELGYGLDLACCAVTGSVEDLVYVSPRSARAVSRSVGRPHHDRLLHLPSFLVTGQAGAASRHDIVAGLQLTGHFLQKYLRETGKQQLPEVRQRLYSIIRI